MSRLRSHYDNLKVSRDAPDFLISAAYRSLCQKYHPDKNFGDEEATRVMAIINASYGVLSDPIRRAEHDAWIAREEQKLAQPTPTSQQAHSVPIPPAWQGPIRSPPPPREELRAFLPVRILRGALSMVAGIFAAFPQLLVGGVIFLILGLVGTCVPKSPPPSGPKPYQTQAPERTRTDNEVSDCRIIKVPPGRGSAGSVIYSYVSGGARTYTSKKPDGCQTDAEPAATKSSVTPGYVRPATAPNGSLWPAKEGYVRGYPVLQNDGHSVVTVDNGRNDSDVFAKLVSLEGETAFPVRQFYIPAHARFSLRKVKAGSYDLRYRDLNSGNLSRSEAFDVQERRTPGGLQYSDINMTLYKVQGGNFHTYDLADEEF